MNRHLLTATAFIALVLGATIVEAAGTPDDVAIIVNGRPISTWELGLLMPQVQAEMAAQGVDPTGEEVIRRTLDRAIDSQLLAQEAIRRGFEANQERVGAKMAAMVENAGGRAELEADLIKASVTYDQLEATAVQADLAQSLVESVILPEITVSDDDVQVFYDENSAVFTSAGKIHARHILIKVGGDATENQRRVARQRADRARARALAGEDFAELAIELSEGPNASKGGDLGFTARGMMVKEFDDAVWALEPGQISEVLETGMGYHVVKVEEIVRGERVPLEDARGSITKLIQQQRLAAALAEFVGELRKNAEIEYPNE